MRSYNLDYQLWASLKVVLTQLQDKKVFLNQFILPTTQCTVFYLNNFYYHHHYDQCLKNLLILQYMQSWSFYIIKLVSQLPVCSPGCLQWVIQTLEIMCLYPKVANDQSRQMSRQQIDRFGSKIADSGRINTNQGSKISVGSKNFVHYIFCEHIRQQIDVFENKIDG